MPQTTSSQYYNKPYLGDCFTYLLLSVGHSIELIITDRKI